MKILLVLPSHLKTVPMNHFSAKALSDLGHEVVIESYHASFLDKVLNKIRNCFTPPPQHWDNVNHRIQKTIANFKPDLLFTIYGVKLSTETLKIAREAGIKTACWWINDPFQFERGLALAGNYDVWFSNSAECARQITLKTGVKAYFLPTACDPQTHKPVEANADFACDVCFAGDWSPEREQLVKSIVNNGINIRIFGPWQKKLAKDSPLHRYLTPGFFTPAQMASYFSSAKIVLNYHTWYGDASHGVNPRLFEAAGCQSVQVVDFKDEITELFDINNEIAIYYNTDELPELIKNLLANPAKREELADLGYKRALKDHTYAARMAQMLDLAFR